MDDSSSSSLCFCSALTDFLSFLLLFSNDFNVLERDLIDLLLAVDLSSSSPLDLLRASMIFCCSSELSAFHSAALRYLPPAAALFLVPFFLASEPLVANAVPCAGTVGVSNLRGLYSFIRVRALWMSVGYASVFPLE